MTNQTLQYFMHDGPSAFRFELAGELDAEGARRLERDWRAAFSTTGDRALIVDITFVTSLEPEGRALLARWCAGGAQLVAKSKVSRELAETILGEPLREAENVSEGWTWLPFHTPSWAPKLHLMLFAVLLLPVPSHAANLKAETVAAWDDYVQSVSSTLQDRARPGGNFLWILENSERIAKVQSGEIIVVPAPGPNPRKVPGGLIHHWVAAAFLPNVKLNDVLEVTQDYDRYKDFYPPTVIASKTLARKAADDYFSILLMNKALFLKTTLDTDYQTTNVRLDDRRFYSVSRTTRVQEIEGFGQRGEHCLPEGEGDGYIWKVFGIGRLEQRDGGVYVEIEAIALSREIPGALRLLVDPIVRRVSRNSVLTSLRQTGEAVRRNSLAHMQPAKSPASAEHTGSTPGVAKQNTSAFARVE
jgi:hypothetical protein